MFCCSRGKDAMWFIDSACAPPSFWVINSLSIMVRTSGGASDMLLTNWRCSGVCCNSSVVAYAYAFACTYGTALTFWDFGFVDCIRCFWSSIDSLSLQELKRALVVQGIDVTKRQNVTLYSYLSMSCRSSSSSSKSPKMVGGSGRHPAAACLSLDMLARLVRGRTVILVLNLRGYSSSMGQGTTICKVGWMTFFLFSFSTNFASLVFLRVPESSDSYKWSCFRSSSSFISSTKQGSNLRLSLAFLTGRLTVCFRAVLSWLSRSCSTLMPVDTPWWVASVTDGTSWHEEVSRFPASVWLFIIFWVASHAYPSNRPTMSPSTVAFSKLL